MDLFTPFTPYPAAKLGGAFLVHTKESNPESQAILKANRKRLSNNCKTLFDALLRGEILNSVVCVERYKIIDWRRRRCDLEANGVMMQSSPSPLGKGLKDWFFSLEDKKFNQKFI